ncbi:hypothetical protein VTO73DRAFT_5885 [Trametes versicolor]
MIWVGKTPPSCSPTASTLFSAKRLLCPCPKSSWHFYLIRNRPQLTLSTTQGQSHCRFGRPSDGYAQIDLPALLCILDGLFRPGIP